MCYLTYIILGKFQRENISALRLSSHTYTDYHDDTIHVAPSTAWVDIAIEIQWAVLCVSMVRLVRTKLAPTWLCDQIRRHDSSSSAAETSQHGDAENEKRLLYLTNDHPNDIKTIYRLRSSHITKCQDITFTNITVECPIGKCVDYDETTRCIILL